MNMLTVELIAKKQRGEPLTADEIDGLIHGFTAGEVPEYQMAALLMAIYFQGLNDEEGRRFLKAMIESGARLKLASISGIKVDKHSTGGVGDKTSLILAPVAAAAGVPVPMISGRALGHTGGTLDKLESIPGFRVGLENGEFEKMLREHGLAYGAQTPELVPADQKLYALRDVTSTISIPPLIAASILSKKIAEGTNGLVMDVKVGSGGFLRSEEEARELSQTLVRWSASENVRTLVFGTDMESPLGRTAGNAPEVLECLEILKTGDGDARLIELCRKLGSGMLLLGEKVQSLSEGEALFDRVLSSGAGYEKFRDAAIAQGADADALEEFASRTQAKHTREIKADRDGFIANILPREVGWALVDLGAGRRIAADAVDHTAGVVFHHRVGERVGKGNVIATVMWSGNTSAERGISRLEKAIQLGDAAPPESSLIKFICDEHGFRSADNLL